MRIVLEGTDGSGKSTQAKRLALYLEELNQKVKLYNNKSDRPIRKLYKELLTNSNTSPSNELFLFLGLADYRYLDDLKCGDDEIRIYDRYIFSSFSDMFALGLSDLDINMFFKHFELPDLIFFIDIEPEVAFGRRAEVSVAEAGGMAMVAANEGDLQKSFKKFQGRVREGYTNIFDDSRVKDRVFIIDGSQSEDEVFEQIIYVLRDEMCV